MFLLLKLGILLSLSYTLLNLYLFYKRYKFRHFPSPPIPLSWAWFMGHLPDLKTRKSRSPNKNLAQLMSEYYFDFRWEMLRLSFFTENVVFCVDLSIISKVLADPVNFPKSPFMNEAQARMNRAAGEKLGGKYTLLMMPGGEVWQAKRRILDPAFKKSFLRSTMDGMNKVVRNLMEVLVVKTDGRIFDIAVDLNRTAMEAVSVCGFDWNEDLIQKHGEKALDLASSVVEIIAVAIKQPFEFSLPWNSKDIKKRYKTAALSVREVMKTHLEKRLGNNYNTGDILSHIIRSNDCSDDLDIEDLIDEYVIFLVAGMETTAITMATVVQFLANHPAECEKVQGEVDEVLEGKEDLVYEDIARLKYLEDVIKESLRMKGPVFGTWRFCQNNNVFIDGVNFPKDGRVYVPFEVLQNDERYWENPTVFNPGRFSGDAGKNIRPFTYMPFSAGLRNCIGKNFAMLEMKVVLSNILRRYNFTNPYPEITDPPRMGNLTMRPLNGVPITITNRY